MSEPGLVPLEELQQRLTLLLQASKDYLQFKPGNKIYMTLVVGRMDFKENSNNELFLLPVFDATTLEDKDQVEAVIERIAEGGAVDVIALISEAWMISTDAKRGRSFEELEQDLSAIYAEYETLEHHPYRQEVLILSAHTRTHDLIYHSLIERDESGKITGFEDTCEEAITREESDKGKGSYSRFRPTRWGKHLTLEEVTQQGIDLRAAYPKSTPPLNSQNDE